MYIQRTVDKQIGVIGLNKPRTNSMDYDFLVELQNEISALEGLCEVKVILIKSLVGFGFSSGMDLSSFMYAEAPQDFERKVFEAVEAAYKINSLILSSEKIYIAELRGPVIGSAASLALSCDMRIAADNTWFWLPDPQFGGLLADGGLELLVSRIGTSRAAEMALTNDRIDLKKAAEWGLLYKIAQIDELGHIAMRTAEKIAVLSHLSLSRSKKIMNKGIIGSFCSEELLEVLSSGQAYERLKKVCWSKRPLGPKKEEG